MRLRIFPVMALTVLILNEDDNKDATKTLPLALMPVLPRHGAFVKRMNVKYDIHNML